MEFLGKLRNCRLLERLFHGASRPTDEGGTSIENNSENTAVVTPYGTNVATHSLLSVHCIHVLSHTEGRTSARAAPEVTRTRLRSCLLPPPFRIWEVAQYTYCACYSSGVRPNVRTVHHTRPQRQNSASHQSDIPSLASELP